MRIKSRLAVRNPVVLLLLMLWHGAPRAACDNPVPTTGQTTTCDSTAANSTDTPVLAAPGSTNVTVNILANAGLDVTTNNGILVYDRSTVINLGTVHVAGDFFDALSAQGTGDGNNVLINRGMLVTTGNFSEGMFNSAAAVVMVNDATGVIRTSGQNSAAMHDFQSPGGGTLVNNGQIFVSGAGSYGMAAASPNDTVINNGSIHMDASGAAGIFTNGGGTATVTNNGTINVTANGAQGITALNAGPVTVTNNGTILATGMQDIGAFFGSPVKFTNGPRASIVVTRNDGVIANGGGTLNNAGTINASGVGIFAGGPATVTNTGSIASSTFVGIWAQGPASIVINSSGNISGAVAAVLTDAGDDSFSMSGGSTTGIVDLGGGSNTVTLTGGAIGSGIRTGTGTSDTLLWRDGGTISGAVTLNGNHNTATLTRLTDANLSGLTVLASGTGTGTLTFDNTVTGAASRFTNWTTINLSNGSQLTLDKPGLVLGNNGIGTGTGTGTLSIDATSTLFAGGLGDPPIAPAQPGQLVTVNNAGVIDLTNGGKSTADVLVITGNYVGQNGRLLMQTVLGADGAPSDRLVLAQGTASGSTTLGITNVGGSGGATVADGIMVVQATNGATTTPSAFTLSAPLMAGAFAYYLFKGGVTTGTADNWYLRSSLAPLPAPAPATDVPASAPIPFAAPGTLPPPPPAGADPTPLYRMEVPVYAAIPETIRELGLAQLSTFHERQGDQSFLNENGPVRAAWGRVWGGHASLSNHGAASPEFGGSIGGLQIGHDLYADARNSGHRDHIGVFIGFARASGDVDGFALGFPGFAAGQLAANAYSLGAYWTHVGPAGWYTDSVIMGSTLTIDPKSSQGIGTTTHGTAIYTSVEGGLPIPLTATVSVEPQAQLIWQHANVNELNDGISTVAFHSDGSVIGRLGARLLGKFERSGMVWQPYLRANLWRYFGGTDSQTYAATTVIPTSVSATAAEFGLGLAIGINRHGSAFLNFSYGTNVDSAHRSIVAGNAGLRWRW